MIMKKKTALPYKRNSIFKITLSVYLSTRFNKSYFFSVAIFPTQNWFTPLVICLTKHTFLRVRQITKISESDVPIWYNYRNFHCIWNYTGTQGYSIWNPQGVLDWTGKIPDAPTQFIFSWTPPTHILFFFFSPLPLRISNGIALIRRWLIRSGVFHVFKRYFQVGYSIKKVRRGGGRKTENPEMSHDWHLFVYKGHVALYESFSTDSGVYESHTLGH